MTPSPPYSQLDELDTYLPDDVTEQVAKLAYLLQAELVEWQAPRSLVAQAEAPRRGQHGASPRRRAEATTNAVWARTSFFNPRGSGIHSRRVSSAR